MNSPRKQKLIDLGADTLAEALLNIAAHSDEADELIEQMIATPDENIQRFTKKLAELKRQNRFVEWHEAAGFARELERMLQDLKTGVNDPLTGVEFVVAFYEADDAIFEICDDSNGYIGNIFCYDAKELFVDYASACTDKEKVAGIILRTNRKDGYGVRKHLIDCAGECLPEDIIRNMIATLQKNAEEEKAEYVRRHYLMLIEALARQIKDAKLFEETRLAAWGVLSTPAFIEIARICLDSGDTETAHSWLNKIPGDETCQMYEREKLLEEIYRREGDTEKLTELLYRKFRADHSTDNLQMLLDVIGDNKRDEVIADEVSHILSTDRLWVPDAEFLIEIGRIDAAEKYLLERAGQIDGGNYYTLPSLAETMESENRYLAASLIYRSLLFSILERAYYKAYYHGVQYLRNLDSLAAGITDWKEFTPHKAFKEQLIKAHSRKRSFWSKYNADI